MIENVQTIGNGYDSLDEFAHGLDDSSCRQILAGILVPPDNQNTRMMTARIRHEFVQVVEVLVIVRQQDKPGVDRVPKMNGIIGAAQPGIRRDLDVVAIRHEQTNQEATNGVVIQIQFHGEASRTSSCGGRTRGRASYL